MIQEGYRCPSKNPMFKPIHPHITSETNPVTHTQIYQTIEPLDRKTVQDAVDHWKDYSPQGNTIITALKHVIGLHLGADCKDVRLRRIHDAFEISLPKVQETKSAHTSCYVATYEDAFGHIVYFQNNVVRIDSVSLEDTIDIMTNGWLQSAALSRNE